MGYVLIKCDKCGNYVDARENSKWYSDLNGLLCECCLYEKISLPQDMAKMLILENVIEWFFSREKVK